MIKDLFLLAGYFGDKQKFLEAINEQTYTFEQLAQMRDKAGMSLLEHAIGNAKFDTAEYLLEQGMPVNIISKDGENEFHCLSPYLHEDRAVDLGWMLLDKGVHLAQQDKHGLTAMASMYIKLIPFVSNSKKHADFLRACLAKKQGLNEISKYGYCVRTLPIPERFKSARDDFLAPYLD